MTTFTAWETGRWAGLPTYRNCTECGERFVAHEAEMCSERCRARRSRRQRGVNQDPGGSRLDRECSECEELFDAPTYRTKVCSSKCKQRRQRRQKREAQNG